MKGQHQMIRPLLFFLLINYFVCFSQSIDSTFNGLKITNYSNGKIKSKIEYNSGKPNGLAQMFDAEGRLTESGFFIKNKWVGNYTAYYSNGQVQHSFNFDGNGKRVGLQKAFHENGVVSKVAFFIDGKENGPVIEFDQYGKKKGEVIYFRDGRKTPLYAYNYNNYKVTVNLDENEKAKEEIENFLIEYVNNENNNLYRKINFSRIESELEIRTKEMQIVELESKSKNQQIELLNKAKALTNSELSQIKKQKEIDRQNFEKQEIIRKSIIEKEKFQKLLFGLFSIFIFIIASLIFITLQKNKKKNKIILVKKQEVEEQKHLVEQKQKEIIDSIHYARRIQRALMTSEKYIDKKLRDLMK